PDEGPVDDLESFDSVGRSPYSQLVEGGHVALFLGDDELSTAIAGDVVGGAERVQPRRAFDAQRCLQRGCRIVDAGVDDAAVVGARLHAQARLTLDDADAPSACRELTGGGEPGDAAADDGRV